MNDKYSDKTVSSEFTFNNLCSFCLEIGKCYMKYICRNHLNVHLCIFYLSTLLRNFSTEDLHNNM